MTNTSILAKNLFALGIIGDLLPNITLGAYFQFVYDDILQLPPFYTSTAFTLFIVFKAFLLLTLGVYIGKTTISLKKLLITSLIPFTFGNYFIWSPPEFIQQSTPFIRASFLVFSFLLFGTGFIIFFLTKSNLFNLFTKEERTSILGFQQLYFIIGLCAGTVLPPIIAGDGWQNLQLLAIFLTVISTLCSLAVLFSLPPNTTPPKVAVKSKQTKEKEVGIFRSLITPFTLSDKFKYFILAIGSIQVGFELLTSNSPLVLKYIVPELSRPQTFFDMEFSGKGLIAFAQILGQVGMLLSTKFWLQITNRYGSVTTWKISSFLFAVATLCQYFFINDSIITFAILQVLGGVTCSALIFLNPLIISEFCELFEKKKPGACSASQIQGVSSVSLNIAAMLRGNINSIVMSLGNYKPGEEQPPTAIASILVLAFIIPFVSLVVSSFSLKHFHEKEKTKAKKQ